MSVWPVIVRELRAQARQPMTYWLRVIGGASVAAAVVMALWSMGGFLRFAPGTNFGPNPIQTFGTKLFGKLNLFIFLAIWVVVPLATADAVSRERREGTLPLLFLTELGSFGIVVGKAFVHILRSGSLFLTMVPWLMLPLVFGGVEPRDVKMALLLDSTSLLLAQAAGLLASAFPRDRLKSIILAVVFALVLVLAMIQVNLSVLRNAALTVPSSSGPGALPLPSALTWDLSDADLDYGGMIARTCLLLELTTDGTFGGLDDERMDRLNVAYSYFAAGSRPAPIETAWQEIWSRLTPPADVLWIRGVMGMFLGAILVWLAALRLAAWRVERSWQDAPATVVSPELRQQFFTPRFGVDLLKRSLSRSLTANPIGWLHQYSPAARLVKWEWCLFIAVAEIAFSFRPEDLIGAQAGVGLGLLLGLTFSATGSFRRELESGAFELLLVTPLRERQIIAGRVRGVWGQFLPATLIYGCGTIYLATGWAGTDYAREAWLALARMLGGFCALPLIGLYFAMKRWNFFAAWLAACVMGLMPPVLARSLGATDTVAIVLQLCLGLAAGTLLARRLRNRRFLQPRR